MMLNILISEDLEHQNKWDPLIIRFEGDVIRPGGNINHIQNHFNFSNAFKANFGVYAPKYTNTNTNILMNI